MKAHFKTTKYTKHTKGFRGKLTHTHLTDRKPMQNTDKYG